MPGKTSHDRLQLQQLDAITQGNRDCRRKGLQKSQLCLEDLEPALSRQ